MDFITDNNPSNIEYIKSILGDKLPNYVNENYDASTLEKKASSVFADSENRLYPIDTKRNTWMSNAYYYTKGIHKIASEAKRLDIFQQLTLAADVHGITNDIKDIVEALNVKNVKTASDKFTEVYAINKIAEDGSEVHLLPINTSEEVIKSASTLANNKDKIIDSDYKIAAINIVKKAKELNICSKEYISASILKDGVERLVNFEYAEKIANDRSMETGCEVYKELVKSAAVSYNKGESIDSYIQEFYKLDKVHDNLKYDSITNPSPYDAFYSGMSKEAAEKFVNENVEIMDNVFIPLSELRSEAFNEKVDINFSKKIASEIKSIFGDANKSGYSVKEDLDSKLDNKTKLEVLKLLV